MQLDPDSRKRSILPLFVGVLAAVYLFVFVPLNRKAGSLTAPLEKSWRQLAGVLGQTNALKLDFVSLTNQLQTTRTALATLGIAQQQAQERVQLGAELRAQLDEPFLLVHYLYEAGRRMDALARLANQKKVAVDPIVFANFPEQSANMKEPALLWAQLAFLDSLLTTAINANVKTIHDVGTNPPTTHTPLASNGQSLAELPVQIELTGPTENVVRFLQTLPLRADEIEASGLPTAPVNKPALFIDQLVLRKQSPDKPDEVRVSLRAVGFVFQE